MSHSDEEDAIEKDEGNKEVEDADEEIEEEVVVEGDEEEDEEDEEDGAKEDEEEEDDFDEDEDEAEERAGRKKKKAKRIPAGDYFLDVEAEEESEAEEEEEEDIEGDLYADEAKEAEKEAPVRVSDYRKTFNTLLAEEEDLNAHIRELERTYGTDYADEEVVDDFERTDIRQQAIKPSVRDPKLWMVKCKPGHEREAVHRLMKKFLLKENTADKLLIHSAIACDHIKGYIYVEADKESHVKQAIHGVRLLFEWSTKLVPIKEMTDVLTVRKKEVRLVKNGWVRIKKGTYRGDLAQVFEAEDARGRVTVRLIPRLDLAALREGGSAHADDTAADGKKRKRRVRPPARFFNPREVSEALGVSSAAERKRDPATGEYYYLFQGNKYKDGFLYKVMNVRSLDTVNVVPTLDELQRFQEGFKEKDDDDRGSSARERESSTAETLARLAAMPSAGGTSGKRRTTFAKGDEVIVIEGDLKNLKGVVESVDGDTVTIMPRHRELKHELVFSASELAKFFKLGDHVKVIHGQHKGETGLIIKIDSVGSTDGSGGAGGIVTLFSDLTQSEVQVLADDIQECSDVTSGELSLGNYQLFDLVSIDPQTVGVIVKIEKDGFRLLDNTGKVRPVRLQEMGNKRSSRDAVATDRHGNPLAVNDPVDVIEGPYRGKHGTVKHIWRHFVWLYSRDIIDNSGVFVTRAGNLASVSSRAKRPPVAAALTAAGAFPPMSPGGSHLLMSPAHPSRAAFGLSVPAGGRGRGAGRGGPSPWLHKTVMIAGGPWKGYLGIVVDATDTTARVELHTNSKIVSVGTNQLKEVNEAGVAIDRGGEPAAAASYTAPTAWEEYPKTPVRGAGGRTPLRPSGARTPLRDDGSMTPLRSAHPSRTPFSDVWAPTTPRHEYSDPLLEADFGDGPSGTTSTTTTTTKPWTPVIASESTPGASPYSGVSTPRYQPPSAYFPYSPSPYGASGGDTYNPSTPTGYMPGQGLETPASPAVHTPGADEYNRTVPTPGPYPSTPATPGMPHTPGTPSTDIYPGSEMYDPTLPSSVGAATEPDGAWLTPSIEVRFVDYAFRAGAYKDQLGVIRAVNADGTAVVEIKGRDEVLSSVPPEALLPVAPSKKDHIKIIRGVHKGQTGVLVGIDGADGIVKLDVTLDIRILDLKQLAKMAS